MTYPNSLFDVIFQENDIYEEILLKSGRSNAFDKTHRTIPHMLCKVNNFCLLIHKL